MLFSKDEHKTEYLNKIIKLIKKIINHKIIKCFKLREAKKLIYFTTQKAL